MKDVTTIDFTERYGKVVEEDVANQKVFFIQNGIEYDGAGKACNKKQIKAHYAKVAAEAQQTADAAREAYEEAQALADDQASALVPDEPKTVPELTAALKDAGVEIPEGTLKAGLEDLWELEKARVAAAAAA
jgi:hypothetical protein